MNAVIYQLIDPRTGSARYVGWCYERRMARRLSEHVSRAVTAAENTPKARWIRDLHSSGAAPVMEVCERIAFDQRGSRERWWIQHLRAAGASLTNAADGGNGCPGYRHTEAARRKMSAAIAGKPKSDEHRRRLAAAHRGTSASETTRRRMSESHRGNVMPRSAVEKTAAAHRGRTRSDESIELMRRAWRKRLGGQPSGATREGARWAARFCWRGKVRRLGMFDTREEAAAAVTKERERLIDEERRRVNPSMPVGELDQAEVPF